MIMMTPLDQKCCNLDAARFSQPRMGNYFGGDFYLLLVERKPYGERSGFQTQIARVTGAPSATVDIKILGVLRVLCPFYWELISLGLDRFSIVMTVINICNILEYSKSFASHGTSKFGASLTFLWWRPDVEHQTPKRWELLCVDSSIDSRYY